MHNGKKLTIKETEDLVPEIARAATRSAYNETRAAGEEVLIYRAGELRKIGPDGETVPVKKMPARRRVRKGSVMRIK